MSGSHDHDHGQSHRKRSTLTSRAAIAGISMAFFLVILKIWASWNTGSVAMLGSLADTTLDLIASMVTLLGVRYAAMPADDDHRFGHGKAEGLAALFQVMLISISAIGIGWRAMDRFWNSEVTQGLGMGIAVSLIAVAATVGLLAYQRYVIRKTGSVAIMADHMHYQSDLMLNLAVITALILDQLVGWRWADPLFGVIIALWLLWGAWRAASQAIDELMDREWSATKREAFLKVALAHPELASIHDLRTRTSGGRDFAQFHVWVDPDMTLFEAHRIMDEIEAKLGHEFPGTEILIHPEPEDRGGDRTGMTDDKMEHHP